MGVALGMRPFAAEGSWWTVDGSGEAWLRLSIFSSDAEDKDPLVYAQALGSQEAYLLADLLEIGIA